MCLVHTGHCLVCRDDCDDVDCACDDVEGGGGSADSDDGGAVRIDGMVDGFVCTSKTKAACEGNGQACLPDSGEVVRTKGSRKMPV